MSTLSLGLGRSRICHSWDLVQRCWGQGRGFLCCHAAACPALLDNAQHGWRCSGFPPAPGPLSFQHEIPSETAQQACLRTGLFTADAADTPPTRITE